MRRRCPKCSAEWEIDGPVGCREECPECAAFMHTCVLCAHYDASTHDCREPTAEPVRDRQSANFCEFFEYDPGAAAPGASAAPDAEAPAKPSGEAARRRFEDLFRDPSE